MMIQKALVATITALVMVSVCSCQKKAASSIYAADDMWYVAPNIEDDSCEQGGTDIFYIVSTNVMGNDSVAYASLSDEERETMTIEMAYIQEHMGKGVRQVAPYYHQLAFVGFQAPCDSIYQALVSVRQEIREAFAYYMEHINHGRKFVLMGYSQGAILVLDLLKHMDAEAYDKMLVAYMMGYRLSEEDLRCAQVRPAQDAEEKGVVVSFNTVTKADAVWHFLSDSAATCINPLNWSTTSTPALLRYREDSSMVYVDSTLNILIAPNIPAEKYYPSFFGEVCPIGNLHHGDILFYLDAIRENISVRKQ